MFWTPGFFGDVGEGAVAIVVIKDRGAPIGDVEIFKAIVIVIAGGNAHGKALASDTGLGCYVGKRAVAIVAEEMIRSIFAVCLGVIGDAFQVSPA